ncbi:unnamed protein product, partial [Clonostachys byssicola]
YCVRKAIMKVPWSRLIRFQAADGRVLRGEPVLPRPNLDLGLITEADNIQARVITGDDPYDTTGATRVTEELVTVKRILCPLTAKDVPILRCVGLNYLKHIQQAGRAPPPFPSIFFKPTATIVGPDDRVVIPKICQDDQADYEGELTIVIGKDAKDVSQEDALDYVAAYTVGNDISSRKLQRDPNYAGRLLDLYTVRLVSSALVREPRNLHLKTTIDGQVRQDESVSDLLFDCKYLISYLSQGTTLEKGSVIMTGTPGGVGGDMKPPSWLRPGTRMEVHISEIGTLRNEVAYA